MNPRSVDVAVAKQCPERQLDDFLALADHVRPAAPLEQDVDGREPVATALEVIANQCANDHDARLQQGWPWTSDRTKRPPTGELATPGARWITRARARLC